MINNYFSSNVTQGAASEQGIVEDLIIESIQIYGVDFYYIPRTLVAKDEILGEDRMSEFKNAYPIEMYVDSSNYIDNTSFMDKFGLMINQTATLTVARKRWDRLVGSKGTSILPNRPAEGDLLYFPLSKGLFEIMYVEDKNPFFQLGKLYVYKLQVELFKYGSEKIDTGVPAIDIFETKKSNDPVINPVPDTPDSFGDNSKFEDKADDIVFDVSNPFNE